MAKKYYYALFDNQMGLITSTCLNQTSKDKVREYLIKFLLLGNFSEEGEDSIKRNTLSELLNYYEFTLLKSDTLFKV
jgi:hypothetical protein